MPLRNLTWLFVAALTSILCYSEANRNRYAGILSESIDKISRYYVKPIDGRQLFEAGMHGMLAELDKNSSYITPTEYGGFREDIEQHFGGIGIEVSPEDDLIKVLHPIVDTPAYKAGLKAGDVIVSIDGQTVSGKSLNDAVKIMRGPRGSVVRLEILRIGEIEPRVYEIERAEIPIESVRGDKRDERGRWSFVLEDAPNIGYLRVRSFGDRTAEEVENTLRELQGTIDGVILDLRQNPGGLLTAAVEMCDLFLEPDQVVVTTRGRDPEMDRSFRSREPLFVDPDLPVVVLVDRYAASASEIFAACLQDYGRARIVGERSYGKGTVQNVIEIEGGNSAFRLTTQTYWRPSEKNIHRYEDAEETDEWGVSPEPADTVAYRDAKEIQRVALERRRRDYSTANFTPAEPDFETLGFDDPNKSDEPVDDSSEDQLDDGARDSDSSEPSSDESSPVVDRQMQRALEVLRELMNRDVESAKAA